jgi:hypothetical protein
MFATLSSEAIWREGGVPLRRNSDIARRERQKRNRGKKRRRKKEEA